MLPYSNEMGAPLRHLELLAILSTSLAPPAFRVAVAREHFTICPFSSSSSSSVLAGFLTHVSQCVTHHLSLSRAWSHLWSPMTSTFLKLNIFRIWGRPLLSKHLQKHLKMSQFQGVVFLYCTKFIHNTLCRCFDENPETS